MTDDWSLKDKKQNIEKDLIEFCNGRYEGTHGNEDVYTIEDIETLRQKLIQDYNQYIRNKYYYPDKMEEIDFIDIINKRFGVEE